MDGEKSSANAEEPARRFETETSRSLEVLYEIRQEISFAYVMAQHLLKNTDDVEIPAPNEGIDRRFFHRANFRAAVISFYSCFEGAVCLRKDEYLVGEEENAFQYFRFYRDKVIAHRSDSPLKSRVGYILLKRRDRNGYDIGVTQLLVEDAYWADKGRLEPLRNLIGAVGKRLNEKIQSHEQKYIMELEAIDPEFLIKQPTLKIHASGKWFEGKIPGQEHSKVYINDQEKG